MLTMNLPQEPEIEGVQELCALFVGIGRKARSSGKTELLLLLDRVPGLVVGLENSRVREEVEAHLVESMETLQEMQSLIGRALQTKDAPGGK